MRIGLIGAIAALSMMVVTSAYAGTVKLTPANPQPSDSQLKQGLSVKYAFPKEIKSLADATSALKKGAKRGKSLIGFDYPDTIEGEPVLTSPETYRVAAGISGYMKFPKAGVYKINWLTNDGLRVVLGGQRVALKDGRAPCGSTQPVKVEVPVAGWYKIDAVYFQRLGTSCLLMEWTPPGGSHDWVPNSMMGH